MLSGLSVALFRGSADAAHSAAALADRGILAVFAPVVELVGLSAASVEGDFDFVVATSLNAFTFASPDVLRTAAALPLYVVGAKTAEAARARGFSLAAEAAADVAALAHQVQTAPGRALYLAGRDRKPDLEQALAGRVTVLNVYEARARTGWTAEEARAAAGATAALHYSERSAALAVRFAEAGGVSAAFRSAPHVCLSRQVAAPLAAFGAARVLWPRTPTEEALFDTLESALADFGAA